MTDEEVAEWESLEAHRVEIQRKIAKIKKRCNKRRARFNQGSIKDTKTQKTPATRAGEV